MNTSSCTHRSTCASIDTINIPPIVWLANSFALSSLFPASLFLFLFLLFFFFPFSFLQPIIIKPVSLLHVGGTFMERTEHPRKSPGFRFLSTSHFLHFPFLMDCSDFSLHYLQQCGLRKPCSDPRGACQVAANDYLALQTFSFGHILLFCKICYFVSRSTAVHEKYNSVTNPASSWMIPLWTLKTI